MPILPVILALLLFATPVFAAPADDLSAAQGVVSSFDDALLGTMKNAKTLGFQGRYDKLAPVIDKDFDLAFTTKLVIGSGWNDVPADKQAAVIDKFRKFTIGTYANRFDGYSGEQINITGAPSIQRDNVRVQTQIVPSSGDPVKLDYILHDTDSGWKIIDIFLQGTISQLATQKSEFQAVLKSDGVDGLMALLDKKTADLSAEPVAQK
jgi:phospholipid transport system substrate-binding protein